MDTAERRARLAWLHRLVPDRRTDDVAAVAESVVALHSSDPATVYLSVLARMDNPSIDPIRAELESGHSLVRHHAMRRTLWVMPHETARTAHAACGRTVSERERRRLLDLLRHNDVAADVEVWLQNAENELLAAIGDAGEIGTRELGEQLPDLSVPLELSPGKRWASTQGAHVRVLLQLGFEGRIVRGRAGGSWITSQYGWSLAEGRVPGGLQSDEPGSPVADLVRSYLERFGPATSEDVSWWTGLPKRESESAIASLDPVEVDLGGQTGWMLHDQPDPPAVEQVPWVALLPALDSTTMGWKQRRWYIDPGAEAELFDRNGNAGPTVWADGEIVGGWGQLPGGEIVVDLLGELGPAHSSLLGERVATLQEAVGDARVKPRFPPPRRPGATA